MNANEITVTEKERDLNAVIGAADSYIRRQYLAELGDAEVLPISDRLESIGVGKNARLFRVASMSCGKSDDIGGKLTNLCSAVAEFDASQVLILDSSGSRADLYMGIAGKEPDRLSMQFETFKSSFQGNFPGARISVLNASANETLLNGFFGEPGIRVSAVSALTVPEESGGPDAYGIERLTDGMYGKPFTMILISEAVSRREICLLRQNLETVYTELSPFRDYTLSVNTNTSENRTQSFTLTRSESASEGKSVTESTTFGQSKNRSKTVSPAQEAQQKKNAANQILGSAVSIGAMFAGLGGDIPILQGLFYGGSISNIFGSAQTLMGGPAAGESETSGEGESVSLGFSEAETTSRQKGISAAKGVSEGTSEGSGRTLQLRYENKSVQNLLSVLEKQIARLQRIEERGGFQCAAYFITGDTSTAYTVSNMYRSLLGRGNSLGQNNAVNVWSGAGSVQRLGEYLKRLSHPVFYFEERLGRPVFTAGTLIAADEYPMYAALPRRSIGGLPVSVHAEFARDVIGGDGGDDDALEIGNIFHMGKTEFTGVRISAKALRGHLFVAGATGMGKSNFCYGLLDSLYRKNVKFMVIEPAKGEYSRVFGGYEGVRVFGTNPNLAPLLKINPFSFPGGIHVSEHIDRLLEIFNSCWPMYAAMPAILKEGLETVYRRRGFDLTAGNAPEGSGFPSFADLLGVLPEILQKSRFSGEVQGNYIGSLVTRVKSLTDGLYGYIFAEHEIPGEILFDENVLIDLSRVGSGETKALLMGMLVMKLQEYRMCGGQMNSPLKHVTLLEEAHHLLRAAAPSPAEGAGLRAMSLEMITNAIAEMRTYGEGFIIADQSPALMDLSVIRNTNTKVAFKLPENSDRMAVGSAMSLSDEQIEELARLECGVAAVCQSSWDAAVLCRIRYFDPAAYKPYVMEKRLLSDDAQSAAHAQGADSLLAEETCSISDRAPSAAETRLISDKEPDAVRRRDRGLVFAAVCPVNFVSPTLLREERMSLEGACGRLERAGGVDGEIALLGREFLKTGICRRRGVIHPYAAIVWKLMGGEECWKRLYPFVAAGNCIGWDGAAREVLGQTMESDFGTQTSLLSLFLQAKGADPVVKDFFRLWKRSVRERKA